MLSNKMLLLLLLFSHLAMSDSLQLHGLQHTSPPCPSPSPGVCPNSCSLYQWCHPTISSSDALFSFCPWSFPASGTFPQSQLFTSDDQNTRVLAWVSVSPVNIQGWIPLRLTGLISLLTKELSRVFSSTTVWRHQFFGVLPSLWSSSHYLWIIFDVQITGPLCCKLLYSQTPSPASSEQFFKSYWDAVSWAGSP